MSRVGARSDENNRKSPHINRMDRRAIISRAEPCSLMPEPTALARRRAFFSHLAVDVDESRDSLSRRVGPGPTRHDVIKCLSVPKYELEPDF